MKTIIGIVIWMVENHRPKVYAENFRELGNAGSSRINLPGNSSQLGFQYQQAIIENNNTNNMHIKYTIFRHMYVNTCMTAMRL